jgi:hypothetical protein
LLKVKVEHPNALRFLLQDELYLLDEDKSLYNTLIKPEPQIETPPPNFNYLGANKKNFLILVNYPSHEFIADEHLLALESILGRREHKREDVAILNLAKNNTAFDLISTHFTPKTLLILGQESLPEGLTLPQFNQREKQGDLHILYTFSFDAMMSNTDNKKVFWEQMKNL